MTSNHSHKTGKKNIWKNSNKIVFSITKYQKLCWCDEEDCDDDNVVEVSLKDWEELTIKQEQSDKEIAKG